MVDITLIIAFTAGLISFLAPCVLPIIPGYLAYLAGVPASGASTHRRVIFLNSLCFVLGFASVFAGLGVLLNTLLERVAYDALLWLSRIGGALVIFFGLYLTGLVRIPFLDREHRLAVRVRFPSRFVTSFVFGAAFAAGWTPCVGAALGAILSIAATQPGRAFTLLFAYAVGLGIPFLLVGLFTAQATAFIQRFARVVRVMNVCFGVLLIVLGVLMFTQNLARIANFELLNQWLLQS